MPSSVGARRAKVSVWGADLPDDGRECGTDGRTTTTTTDDDDGGDGDD